MMHATRATKGQGTRDSKGGDFQFVPVFRDEGGNLFTVTNGFGDRIFNLEMNSLPEHLEHGSNDSNRNTVV